MGRKRPAAEQGPRLPVLQNCNSLLAQTWEGLGEGAQGRVQEGMGVGRWGSPALLVLAPWGQVGDLPRVLKLPPPPPPPRASAQRWGQTYNGPDPRSPTAPRCVPGRTWAEGGKHTS